MNAKELDSCGSKRWFALRVKPRSEKIVATITRNKGFEEFLPLQQTHHRWSDRIKAVDLPLFPGYLFCRIDPQYRLPILTIPGALHFVGIGKAPVPVEDAEIEAIQATLQSGLPAEPWPYLNLGQRVQLESGPLAGIEGLLIEVRKQHRLVVSVSLLGRSVAVEIEREWVRPVDMKQTVVTTRFEPVASFPVLTSIGSDGIVIRPRAAI
jgi:transcription antitermination factor NusG